MRPIYSPDCDCGIVIEHPQLQRTTASTHGEAARLFSEFKWRWEQAEARNDMNFRYWVVHGPGGHVIGVCK